MMSADGLGSKLPDVVLPQWQSDVLYCESSLFRRSARWPDASFHPKALNFIQKCLPTMSWRKIRLVIWNLKTVINKSILTRYQEMALAFDGFRGTGELYRGCA